MPVNFNQLGLINELLEAIETQGYKEPSEVQALTIPVALKNVDIQASAQTGTGKTAAFALPILQKLNKNKSESGNPRALILTPTRELAVQIAENTTAYGVGLELTTATVFGGASMNTQIKKLQKGVDILIATPGRLLDHIGQKTVDLSEISIFVLDEADRMLDMGFKHEIRRVQSQLPKHKQNMLFSATFPRSVKELAEGLLKSPVNIQCARSNSAADNVTQVIHPVAADRKIDLLTHIINEGDLNQVLVFTKTKETANVVTEKLKSAGISAVALHGNKSQASRRRALEDFKNIKVRILVATDVASRGIDIDTLLYVINYELPGVPEDYIHRIGRTGRAGNKGKAITFIAADDRRSLRDIERYLKREIPVKEIGDFRRGDQPSMKARKSKSKPKNEHGPKLLDGDKRGAKPRGVKGKKKSQKKFKRH
jgi:ATP-dependent RNA helicase RhlE